MFCSLFLGILELWNCGILFQNFLSPIVAGGMSDGIGTSGICTFIGENTAQSAACWLLFLQWRSGL